MSSDQLSVGGQIAVELYPKALANHLSKLPGIGDANYGQFLLQLEGARSPEDQRVQALVAGIGEVCLSEDVPAETRALYHCLLDREDLMLDEQPAKRPGFERTDANQIRDGEDPHGRTLEHYIDQGLTVAMTEAEKEDARRIVASDPRDVPLLEKLKAARIMSINGFGNSRVMYLVHDMIDHAWLFNHLETSGVFPRYADFLDSIDMNVNSAFLYSRQSELLSTVGFGSRRYMLAKDQEEQMVLTDDHILDLLDSSDDPRAAEAGRVYCSMTDANRGGARFVIENMAVQLADERRRWGAVKQWNADRTAQQPIHLLDPIHASLLIESVNALQQHPNYRTVQLEAIAAVDTLLEWELYSSTGDTEMQVSVPRGDGRHLKDVDPAKLRWFNQHLDFSTSYNRVD